MDVKIVFLTLTIILSLTAINGEIKSTFLNTLANQDYFSRKYSYIWQNMGPGHRLPDNSVLGGQNIDTTPLFVARGRGPYRHLYGKLAIRFGNNNAYFGENGKAIETDQFQVLTAKSYVWCYPETVKKTSQVIQPVCRSTHLDYLCIGQLEGNRCGLSWGADVIYYTDYEVLVIGTEC